MSISSDPTHASTGTGDSVVGTTRAGRGFTVGSFICAAVALLLLPIIFGPIGAVLGFVGYSKGDRAGLWAGIASIVATFLGLVIAAAVMNNAS